MSAQNNNALATENVGKLLMRLALPSIAAQVINMLYNLVDRIYIGRIPEVGKLALTGLGIRMPLILIVSAFASLVGSGSAPRASIHLGKGDKAGAEKILGNAVTLLLILSVVLTAFFMIFSEKLLLMFGASQNTIQYATDYMMIYAMGTVFVQLTLGLNTFISAQGFAKESMITVLIGAVLNIILDPIFIFTFNMGTKGAAIATIISQAVSMIWTLSFLMGKKTTIRIKKEYLKLDSKIFLPCLALGLSPFIMLSTESLITITFNSSLFKYGGDLAVGAMTILSSVMQFAMLPLSGITQGAQPIISYNFGAKNIARVKEAFKILLKYCLSYSMLLWLAIMLFPEAFVKMFNNDPALLEFTVPALRIYMGMVGIFGVQIACQQTFVALGNAKNSLFLALLRKVILLIPLIYILPMFMQDKTTAIFVAQPVADIIAVSTTALMFSYQYKKLGA